METLIVIFVVSFAISVTVGSLLITKFVKPQKESWLKYFQLAFFISIFYTPTIGMGGHGIAILPTCFAIIMTESKYFHIMIAFPAFIFVVCLLANLDRFLEN